MLNLTDFCWVLEAHGPAGLKLKIYTAPKMARELLRVLPRSWKPCLQNARCVRVRRGSAILSFFRALGQHPQVTDAVREYVATYRGRGSRSYPMRVAAVKKVLRALHTGSGETLPVSSADTVGSLLSVSTQTPLPWGRAGAQAQAQGGADMGSGTVGCAAPDVG